MNSKFLQFFTICLLFFVSSTFAQGILVGVVSDSVSDFSLPGANVSITGTLFGASTDLNGEFRITNIPAGNYDIRITYIGYQTKLISQEIIDGETKALIINLYPEAIEGEVIVVTAQARGQQQAINQQLASDKIANIVSEQRIQELPDFNAAAALSRLPGISTTKSSGEDSKVIIRGLSPKYNSIEIEGVKLSATGSTNMGLTSDYNVYTPGVSNDRSVDLTMVSPYMIRTIAVYKSLTPDMNANSIGGTVNMELREAPEETHYDLLWQQGYTAKSNTYGNFRAVISGSRRFFNNRLGVYALGNYESYDRNADNLDANYNIVAAEDAVGDRPVLVESVTFNRHLETRERFGGNLILDYNLPSGSLKFVNMFARLNSDYTDHRQTINYDQGRLNWRMQDAENIVDQRMHSLKLDYDFNLFTADLSASYTGAKNEMENSPVINFGQTGGVIINKEDSIYNRIPEEMISLITYQGDDEVTLWSGNLFSTYYQEENLTFKSDFEFPFNIGSQVSGLFKFGGQFTNKEISTDQEAPYLSFNGGGGALDPTNTNIQPRMIRIIGEDFGLYPNTTGFFTGDQIINTDNDLFDAFLDDKYGDVYYVSDSEVLSDIIDYIIGNPTFNAGDDAYSPGNEGGWYDGPYQQLTNDYTYDENYYAGYAMTKVNWWDIMLLGGVRYEKVESDYFAYNAMDIRNSQLQRMYDTTSVAENDFLLPMMQVKYSPLDWMDVRYAYTQTLARPDYHRLSPKFTITQSNSINTGNPELKPAQAFNHDLNFTFHSNKLGLLTVGAFYKTVEDFVYSARYTINWADHFGTDSLARYTIIDSDGGGINPQGNTDYTIYRPLNNPNDAYVKGIEFDFQHNFWYLPRPFNGMVFGLNYTRISSETKYPFAATGLDRTTRPWTETYTDSLASGRLIDQPNHVLNSYIGMDYKGFSARLSFLYTDNYPRYISPRNPENDSFTEEYFRIDFSARQRLPWFNSELFLDVANLNDQNDEWKQKSTGGYRGIRNYGLTANLGIRIRY